MLLTIGLRRTTDDIDFAVVAPEAVAEPGQIFRAPVVRSKEIAARSSSTAFSEAVKAVASEYRLQPDWINDEGATYCYNDAPEADILLWRVFSDVLFCYLPTAEYVFALKIAAFRDKDMPDIAALRTTLNITTLQEAQAIMDKFLLPEAQMFWEVKKHLRRLFR